MSPQENVAEPNVHKSHAGGFTPLDEDRQSLQIFIDGRSCEAFADEPLIEAINRAGRELAQVCYHPQLGPIQTCDTCMVEIARNFAAGVRHKAAARYACADRERTGQGGAA